MVHYLKNNIRRIRYITSFVSVALMVVSLAAFATKGLNMGLDFTGGMVTEVQVDKNLGNNDLLEHLKPNLGEFTSVTTLTKKGVGLYAIQYRMKVWNLLI